MVVRAALLTPYRKIARRKINSMTVVLSRLLGQLLCENCAWPQSVLDGRETRKLLPGRIQFRHRGRPTPVSHPGVLDYGRLPHLARNLQPGVTC